MAQRQLYGGAITTTIPPSFIDASDLRQVPDTQEVFLAPDSDLSLITEVLELVKDDGAGDDLERAVRPGLPTILGPAVLSGLQTISKFNRPASEADTVLILLALWRVPQRDADVTLCVNWPVKDGETGEERSEEEARRVFEEAVRAFDVKDFGLFAGGEAAAGA
uniref:Ran-interacting Mog1 protein n=1 Tax=Rhodotorula toruloides TaxID=5286 RepID=A0A0K3CEM9_RHOTO